LAISKARKEELVAQYADQLDQSNGFIIVQYGGLSVKRVDDRYREPHGRHPGHLGRRLRLGAIPYKPSSFVTGLTALLWLRICVDARIRGLQKQLTASS
jgi:hypothetical protein